LLLRIRLAIGLGVVVPQAVAVPDPPGVVIGPLVGIHRDAQDDFVLGEAPAAGLGDHFPGLSREELPVAQAMQEVPHRVLDRQLRGADDVDPCVVGAQHIALAVSDGPDREHVLIGQLGEVVGNADSQAQPLGATRHVELRADDPSQIRREVRGSGPDSLRRRLAHDHRHHGLPRAGQDDLDGRALTRRDLRAAGKGEHKGQWRTSLHGRVLQAGDRTASFMPAIRAAVNHRLGSPRSGRMPCRPRTRPLIPRRVGSILVRGRGPGIARSDMVRHRWKLTALWLVIAALGYAHSPYQIGSSGFRVGAPTMLGRKPWGTRPADSLGFAALEPPQHGQEAERG